MNTIFFVVVALFSPGDVLASNIHLSGPVTAVECMAQVEVVASEPSGDPWPGDRRSVRCMSGTQVSAVLTAEKSCTLIEGRPNDFDRDYACTGEVAK